MSILIVDDKEENLCLLKALLQGNGHEVASAKNGAEALEKLKSGRIELIISDILMPVMDGFQLCRKVKTDETLRHIPFIIYTATYTGPRDEEFAIKIGADRFIIKPCEPDVFMAAVQDVMAARRSDIASTPPPREEEVLELYNERLVRKLEQKLVTKALAASERKYRMLAENTLDVIWAMNLDLTFTYVNSAVSSLLGYLPEEWIGSRLSEHCDEENFAKMVKIITDEVARGPEGAGVILEAVMLDRNQEPIPVEIHGKAIFGENGAPILLQGTTRDISERKRSEKMLRESEEKYKSILDNIEDGYYEVDLTGNLTFFNRSLCRILGYSSSELMGMNNREYMDKENARKVFQTFNRVFETGEPLQSLDWEVIKKDGARCYLNNAVSLIRDTKGNAIGFRGIARDITGRRNAEKEKAFLTKQLQQSQKMESIGTLAGGIAHDFNNILSSVIGFTELALDDVEKGSIVEDSLQEIYTAGKRAKDLVKQILTFARKAEDEITPIRLDTIAREVLKFIRSSIPATIEIKSTIESSSLIMGNITQVHQVLMNLCTNAAHAMEHEGGVLEVGLKDVMLDSNSAMSSLGLKPGNYIGIKVSDTGVGIPPNAIESIFEPYYTTKPPGEGTGMGLSVVHGIVESYGGRITVESELGKGTTLTIYLPITKKQEKHLPYESETLPTGTERILFVDDEHPIAKISSQGLERLGYSVTTRTSSVEALELFRSKPNDFDLVITDKTMPKMTGEKLANELLKIRSNIPVILCTGYNRKISGETTSETGIKAFAYKPIVMADLAKTVRKVLDKSPGHD